MSDNQNKILEIIPPPIKRNKDTRIFLRWTIIDMFVMGIILLVSGIIWIPLLITNNAIAGLIVIVIFLLLAMFSTIEITAGLKVYTFIFNFFKFCYSQKEIQKAEIKKNEKGNFVRYCTKDKKEYFKLFDLLGYSTDLLDDDHRKAIYNRLSELYYSVDDNNRFDLVKIKYSVKINKLKLKSKNNLVQEYIDEENKRIADFDLDENQEKYILLIASKNEKSLEKYINEIKNVIGQIGIHIVEVNNETEQNYLNQICLNGQKIILKKNHFIVNNEFKRIVAINRFEPYVGREWQDDVFKASIFPMVCKIFSYDAETSKKMLNKAVEKQQYECNINKRDLIQRHKDMFMFDALQAQQEKIAKSDQKLLNVQYLVCLSAKSLNELKTQYKYLTSNFRSKGIYINNLFYNQYKGILTYTTGEDLLSNMTGCDILSSTLATGFVFDEVIKQDANCLCLGKTLNGVPVAIDWKKKDATRNIANTTIIGNTGKGKTTTAKRVIKNQIAEQTYKVFVLDPENEYSNLIKSWGGTAIGTHQAKINPFQFISYKKEKNGIVVERKLEHHLLMLDSFFSMILENLWTDVNKIRVMEAIGYLYSKQNKQEVKEFTFTDLYKHLVKTLDNNKNETLLEVIKSFTKGNVYGEFFDFKSDFNIESDHIAFNFNDLTNQTGKNKIQQTKMLLLLYFLEDKVIQNFLEDNPKYISIFIDEGHVFSKSDSSVMIDFIDNLFRRIRKYNGMVTYITQNLIDLVNNSHNADKTKSIINNSQFLFCFYLKDEDKNILNSLIQDKGGLTADERVYISSCENGRCLLFNKEARIRMNVFM